LVKVLEGIYEGIDDESDITVVHFKLADKKGILMWKQKISLGHILADKSNVEKVEYLKSIGLRWNEAAEFPDCIGGFVKGYMYVSGVAVMENTLEDIKKIF
jgi:hypothetical protein